MQSVQLRVVGPEPSHRLRYDLLLDEEVRLGRAPEQGWDVPWDLSISREHADLRFHDDQLDVKVLESALNSVHYNNQKLRQVTLKVGESFRIGMTSFHLQRTAPAAKPEARLIDLDADVATDSGTDVLFSEAISHGDLRGAQFGCAEQQIEVLARLPELIQASTSDQDLASMLTELLLEGIPHAVAVAAAAFDVNQLPEDPQATKSFPPPRMANVDVRDGFAGRFQPSRKLIHRVLTTGTSALQISGGSSESDTGYTMTEGLGWAFATPIPGAGTEGWCLYVSGRGGRDGAMLVDQDTLKGDLRFAELMAQFIAAVRQVRSLEAEKSQLSAFFSPSVIKTISASDSADALKPSEREITVLFCDLRGFSRKAERESGNLMELLMTVRTALGMMATGILDFDGTIADFQGDAALGFWGWPMELADGPVPACQAALEIYERFREVGQNETSELFGISLGMGISHGRAVAGEIGTLSQAKVGAFGPVVNQGSRLEGMTKMFGVPICVDEVTADIVRRHLSPDEVEIRRLGRVCPSGMEEPMFVYSLTPGSLRSLPDQASLQAHDEAVTHFLAGRWDQALKLLNALPDFDGPSLFLRAYLDFHDYRPPAEWNGVIDLQLK